MISWRSSTKDAGPVHHSLAAENSTPKSILVDTKKSQLVLIPRLCEEIRRALKLDGINLSKHKRIDKNQRVVFHGETPMRQIEIQLQREAQSLGAYPSRTSDTRMKSNHLLSLVHEKIQLHRLAPSFPERHFDGIRRASPVQPFTNFSANLIELFLRGHNLAFHSESSRRPLRPGPQGPGGKTCQSKAGTASRLKFR